MNKKIKIGTNSQQSTNSEAEASQIDWGAWDRYPKSSRVGRERRD